MNYQEANETIRELNLDDYYSPEESEGRFQEYYELLEKQFPEWEDFVLGSRAVTMMRIEVLIGGPVNIWVDSKEEPELVLFIGRPDYGS